MTNRSRQRCEHRAAYSRGDSRDIESNVKCTVTYWMGKWDLAVDSVRRELKIVCHNSVYAFTFNIKYKKENNTPEFRTNLERMFKILFQWWTITLNDGTNIYLKFYFNDVRCSFHLKTVKGNSLISFFQVHLITNGSKAKKFICKRNIFFFFCFPTFGQWIVRSRMLHVLIGSRNSWRRKVKNKKKKRSFLGGKKFKANRQHNRYVSKFFMRYRVYWMVWNITESSCNPNQARLPVHNP